MFGYLLSFPIIDGRLFKRLATKASSYAEAFFLRLTKNV